MRRNRAPTTLTEAHKISADDVVIALIDRLISTEKRMDAMRKELNEHMEMIAEIEPKLGSDGRVTVRAMDASETPRECYVEIEPVKVTPINP